MLYGIHLLCLSDSCQYMLSHEICTGSFLLRLLFASCFCVIGNIVYALALPYESLQMVLLGRLLTGFGSSRVINRRYIGECERTTCIIVTCLNISYEYTQLLLTYHPPFFSSFSSTTKLTITALKIEHLEWLNLFQQVHWVWLLDQPWPHC